MKKYLLAILTIVTILSSSCELFEKEEDLPEPEEVILPLTVTFDLIGGNATILTQNGTFSNAYWNGSSIHFDGSNDPSQARTVNIIGLNLSGIGQYPIYKNPYATVYADHSSGGVTYSTKLDPTFWINNGNNLIVGGTGFTPSYYSNAYANSSGGDVTQGGYVNITEYSSDYISGNYYFVGWWYSNQLNREVMWGVTGVFENVPHQ